MSRRIVLSSCLLAIMVGCSSADEGVGKPGTGRGGANNTSGSGGSSGSGNSGTGGAGGSTGGSTGTGGSSGGSTGTGGSTGGTGGTTGTGGSAGKGGTGGSTGGTGGTGGATGGTGGATGGTGGATGGTGGATGGTGGTGGATGGTGGATGGSAGTGGATGGTGGTAGTGGTGGAKDGGVVDAGTGGTGGSGPAVDGGVSKCGAPLFGNTPTEQSVQSNGTLTVANYTGLPSASTYKDMTVYYPSNGTGPYVVVAIMPGFTTASSLLAPWGKFMASHGYVGVTVEPLNTNVDQPSVRGDALWGAIQTMKGENTRSGSALNGKISDCFVVMGHSMGGGGSLFALNSHPNDIKGAIPLNPYQPNGSFPKIVGPTLILAGQDDTTAAVATNAKPHYASIPATTIKQYVEASGGNHQSAFSPSGLNARYAVSWIKYNIDGDARYRPLLDKAASGISTFETTVK